jgi:hypothetical protein
MDNCKIGDAVFMNLKWVNQHMIYLLMIKTLILKNILNIKNNLKMYVFI